MHVTVKAFAGFREVMPREIAVGVPERATVGDLLDILTDRYPGLGAALFIDGGELRPYVNILKSGRNIHFTGGFATPLADGDIVTLFPPAAGG
ncbi:molybdenum cofactor biosynthesis protein MoaD [Methanoculleus taiwanensis]|uniref:Molybdenum cofactor biosynthesis protein MoaD n=1 Tax=Methanoculleus taiwanensis TaxID=1550565 RepID=A0A498H3B4_9EURY|nr:ubiquitin-like small modifier protein 1 [Methanoculleus taiwanensis]RXE56987.1 molybdenum cofactor biosynthesis protein MoaD [Methanoculleus taiwanensis]